MSTTLKWLLGILIGVIVTGGSLWGIQWYGDKLTADYLKSVAKPITKPIVEKISTEKKTTTETTPVDEYAGWKTYENKTIGYTLKYPADWTVKEIETYNETIGKNVKYITITTADGKYFLHFGLKRPTDTFAISDRTGIGAGDVEQKTDWAVKILNISVIPEALVWQNKVKEIFYYQPSGTTTTCNCQFTSTFSYTDKADYNTYDMTNLTDERNAVNKILKSVKLL
jgi:hypothetical protein